VVAAMRNIPVDRLLAGAELVWDLPRLLIPPAVPLRALVARQEPEAIGGELWLVTQHLECSDQAVASKQRDKPGDARGKEVLPLLARGQHLQVAEGPVDDSIEIGVVSFDHSPSDGWHRIRSRRDDLEIARAEVRQDSSDANPAHLAWREL